MRIRSREAGALHALADLRRPSAWSGLSWRGDAIDTSGWEFRIAEPLDTIARSRHHVGQGRPKAAAQVVGVLNSVGSIRNRCEAQRDTTAQGERVEFENAPGIVRIGAGLVFFPVHHPVAVEV